jgi:hypothetical protein
LRAALVVLFFISARCGRGLFGGYGRFNIQHRPDAKALSSRERETRLGF